MPEESRPSPEDDPVGRSQIRLCREAPLGASSRSDSVGKLGNGRSYFVKQNSHAL